MTDAERAREVRRLVAERFGLQTRTARAGTDEQEGPSASTEDLRTIHRRAQSRLSAGRRLASWPASERATSWPAGAQTASVFLPRTGAPTASARSAQRGPGSPASRSQ